MNYTLPEKHYYTIGDVSKLTGVKPHVLRYWESHFKLLRPARRYSGHRKYLRGEIDVIQRIKQLVVDKKFTLAGAKREIGRLFSTDPHPAPAGKNVMSAVPVLQEIKNDIEACLNILEASSKPRQEFLDLK